ncbi:MAG: fructose-6-phosphate aldolase [Polyangia bacterium]|jgi:transaldolase|nr:fructose-6-phosphate aldolase [Polyangia bacterium]
MLFFIDSAEINEIRSAHEMGLVDGVTTNPSLVAKTGRPFAKVIEDICKIVDGPISAEAIQMEYEPLVAEARDLARIHPNIVVKVPLVADGLRAVRTLASEGIRTNVTLCFSATQALLAAKAGATYISPFVGRLDDISHVGMGLISEILDIYGNYDFDTQVLVASIRNPLHVLEAAQLGAHVATIPYKVMLQLVRHPLTDLGIQAFLEDWEKVPKP